MAGSKRIMGGLALPLAALLAGCASLPTAQINGALKPGGFAFAQVGETQQDALQALVADRLASRGLALAPTARADYIVYLGFSALPIRTGLYLPDVKAPQAPPGDWVIDPRKGKKLHLQIVVLDRASGQAVFDGGATLTGPARHAKTALPELVDAALGPPRAKP